MRHILLSAFKETVALAIGPAAARMVEVSLRFVDGVVRLRVSHNGTGAGDEEWKSRMDTLRERMHAIGGRIDIATRTGEGTKVTCEVKADASDTSVLRKSDSPPPDEHQNRDR